MCGRAFLVSLLFVALLACVARAGPEQQQQLKPGTARTLGEVLKAGSAHELGDLPRHTSTTGGDETVTHEVVHDVQHEGTNEKEGADLDAAAPHTVDVERDEHAGEKVSPANRRFMFIGDSNSVGVFGKALTKDLKAVYERVHRNAFSSSTTKSFTAGEKAHVIKTIIGYHQDTGKAKLVGETKVEVPKVDYLLDLEKKEVPPVSDVVVALGANDVSGLYSGTTGEFSKAQRDILSGRVTALVDQIFAEGSTVKRCFWVLPPSTKRRPAAITNQFAPLVEKGIALASRGKCHIFDTTAKVGDVLDWDTLVAANNGKEGDKIHIHYLGEPGRAACRTWAKAVTEWIQKWDSA